MREKPTVKLHASVAKRRACQWYASFGRPTAVKKDSSHPADIFFLFITDVLVKRFLNLPFVCINSTDLSRNSNKVQ